MANEAKSGSNREQLKHVRVRTGGVHFNGARIITTLTTDQTAVNIASGNMLICESITTHPAGVWFDAPPRRRQVHHPLRQRRSDDSG